MHLRLVQHITYRLFASLVKRNLAREIAGKQNSMICNMKIGAHVRKTEQESFIKRRKEVLGGLKIYEDDDVHHPFMMV